jgi:arylsulfatase A-like enzyme
MADTFVQQGLRFIDESRRQPFFLYFATHDIHVPRLPHPRFAGRTKMGPRGDAIASLDWSVGQLLGRLDRLGLTRNTLVMFSSDNGPVVDDGYKDQAAEKLGAHRPAGNLRGGKYSNFEGGTRVPLLARWPERIKPTVSDALIGQQDFFASLATLTGQKLTPEAAPDSLDVLPALLGEAKAGREWIIEHSRSLSFRQGDYKLIEPNDGPATNPLTNTDLGNAPSPQLYRVSQDRGEQQNLASAMPDKVKELATRLNEVRAAGRSRP